MSKKMCLSPCALGTALGITWGLALLIMACLSAQFGWGKPLVDALASVYIGYASGLVGGLIGFIWGFIDFFIFGAIVAFIYNLCIKRCCCKKSGDYCQKDD